MQTITCKSKDQVYDAVIVGSGAAGGMAAYVMANAGMNVLVLEAGPQFDLYKDFKTHHYPYDEKYRWRLSPRDAHNYKYARERARGRTVQTRKDLTLGTHASCVRAYAENRLR